MTLRPDVLMNQDLSWIMIQCMHTTQTQANFRRSLIQCYSTNSKNLQIPPPPKKEKEKKPPHTQNKQRRTANNVVFVLIDLRQIDISKLNQWHFSRPLTYCISIQLFSSQNFKEHYNLDKYLSFVQHVNCNWLFAITIAKVLLRQCLYGYEMVYSGYCGSTTQTHEQWCFQDWSMYFV